MRPATCTPGQRLGPVHLVAPAGGVVLLQPGSGGFGTDPGSVDLLDPAFPEAAYPLSVACLSHLCPAWRDDAVGVNLPMQLRAPADLPRLFRIRVTSCDGGQVHEAGGVAIVGPPGSGFPVHPPLPHDQALLHGTLTEGPFGAVRPLTPPVHRTAPARDGVLGGLPYRRTVTHPG